MSTQSINAAGAHSLVTTAGKQMLAELGTLIKITSYRFANGCNYVPDADQSTFNGKLTGVEEGTEPQIDGDNMVYQIMVPAEINFDFGEIGLYAGHTLVALIVLESLVEVRFGGEPVGISCTLPLPVKAEDTQ